MFQQQRYDLFGMDEKAEERLLDNIANDLVGDAELNQLLGAIIPGGGDEAARNAYAKILKKAGVLSAKKAIIGYRENLLTKNTRDQTVVVSYPAGTLGPQSLTAKLDNGYDLVVGTCGYLVASPASFNFNVELRDEDNNFSIFDTNNAAHFPIYIGIGGIGTNGSPQTFLMRYKEVSFVSRGKNIQLVTSWSGALASQLTYNAVFKLVKLGN
jgi:hypothetical protein